MFTFFSFSEDRVEMLDIVEMVLVVSRWWLLLFRLFIFSILEFVIVLKFSGGGRNEVGR